MLPLSHPTHQENLKIIIFVANYARTKLLLENNDSIEVE